MRFSRTLKSSTQSLPSPDGSYVATIFPSKLSIRETRSLSVKRAISLPPDLAASISWFLWSPSSSRILIASADQIRVYSVTEPKFSATITHPSSGLTKVAYISFGADENEVCVFLDLGMKLSIYSLSTSKTVDISSPKNHNPGSANRGFAYRPRTANLTLLTRNGGKDIISIHAKGTLDVIRSWWPETIDAQGLCWSPDGNWLVVWESAAFGHKMYIYTAGGQLFKTWNGPRPLSKDDFHLPLGPGIKLVDWSQDGTLLAIGDHTERVTILSSRTFTDTTGLFHKALIKPADTLQIWQEQITLSQSNRTREFIQASQPIRPPTLEPSPSEKQDAKTGTSLLSFDNAGTLLATRTEEMPTTIWIWDLSTRTLRAVMILHAPIAKATWHPTITELLMIRCEGDDSRGLVHLWEPSWESPRILDFGANIPGGKVIGKTIVRWLNIDSEQPILFFSDAKDYLLCSLSDEGDGSVPWEDSEAQGISIYSEKEESLLELVPAPEKRQFRKVVVEEPVDDFTISNMSSGSDENEMDDTFSFKKFVEPRSSLTAKTSPNPWT